MLRLLTLIKILKNLNKNFSSNELSMNINIKTKIERLLRN
jgi:hypothetical protein